MINVFLMDAMGGFDTNNGVQNIRQLPVRLYINFPTNDLEQEIYFNIVLTNPDNRTSASFKGILNSDIKEFSPILPIKSIIGEWKLNIKIRGSEISDLHIKLNLTDDVKIA